MKELIACKTYDFVGEDYHCTIELELRPNLGKVEEPVFVASGTLWKKGEGTVSGQCIEEIYNLVQTDLVKRIYNLWKDWHMNNLHEGCIHQRAFEKEPYENHRGHHCDICNYTYGHAWIYEPIPKEVLDEINDLMK